MIMVRKKKLMYLGMDWILKSKLPFTIAAEDNFFYIYMENKA